MLSYGPAIFDVVGRGGHCQPGAGTARRHLGLLPELRQRAGQGFAAVNSVCRMGMRAACNGGHPGGVAKALENLGPKSQQLAKQIVKLQDPFKDLKRTVGNQLAPGFTQLTKAAGGYIPIMEKALAGSAKVFSGAASSMAATLATGSTKSMVGSIMGTNTRVLAQLTQALVPMFRTVHDWSSAGR